MNRIESDLLLTDLHRTRFVREFFGLVRKQISEWFEFTRFEFQSRTFPRKGEFNMI